MGAQSKVSAVTAAAVCVLLGLIGPGGRRRRGPSRDPDQPADPARRQIGPFVVRGRHARGGRAAHGPRRIRSPQPALIRLVPPGTRPGLLLTAPDPAGL